MKLLLGETFYFLRRSYFENRVQAGRITTKKYPTGIQVITQSKPIGIAAKEKGVLRPWRSHRKKIEVGKIAIPKMIPVSNPTTVDLFKKLGIFSPPETNFVKYGEKFLIAGVLIVDDVFALIRMQNHILEENGYGLKGKIGELAKIYDLLDQIDIITSELEAGYLRGSNERQNILYCLAWAIRELERKIDPYKSQARQNLELCWQQLLNRADDVLASAQAAAAKQRLERRIHLIENRLSPLISARMTVALNLLNRTLRTVNRISRQIRLKKTPAVKIKNCKLRSNAAVGIEKLAEELRLICVRPFRRNARLSASLLVKAAEHLRNGNDKIFQYQMDLAAKILENLSCRFQDRTSQDA